MSTSAVANAPGNVEAKWVFLAAEIVDIAPIGGSIKNVIDLFLRFCWKPQDLSKLSPVSRAYYIHLHEKNLLGNILLIIPGLGTVLGIFIFLKKHCIDPSDRKENTVQRVETRRNNEDPDEIIREGFRTLGWSEARIEQYFRDQRKLHDDGLRVQREYQDTERRWAEAMEDTRRTREKFAADRIAREAEREAQNQQFHQRIDAITLERAARKQEQSQQTSKTDSNARTDSWK